MTYFVGSLAGGLLVATALSIWLWPRMVMDPVFARRVATVGGIWLFGGLGLTVGFGAEPILAWVGCGAAALALAGTRWLQLRATPVEDHEASSRVSFEGTAHALSGLVALPSFAEIECVAWVVRQGGRRWSSDAVFEVRSGDRRVLVDPAAMTVLGKAWDAEYYTLRKFADELGGDRLKLLRAWKIDEGERVFVVGESTFVEDAERVGYRDPVRVHRFGSKVLLGRPSRAAAMRAVWMFGAAAIAFGAVAGAIAIFR